MESDLLKKEEEYRIENERLELQTRKLLKEVDGVKKIQEIFVSQSIGASKITAQDLNLPKSVDQMGNKGMIHFYRAKLKTLQVDNEKLQNELKQKGEELKKILRESQNAAEEKEKWFLQCTSEKNNSAKLEKQLAALSAKFQVKENDNMALKRETEQLKAEVRSIGNDLSSVEGRLARVQQESEKVKGVLKTVREEEKELRDTHKRQLGELTNNIKKLQKQKSELLCGYRKQGQLVDNVKKQKAIIESLKVTELAELEFMKLLEWKKQK